MPPIPRSSVRSPRPVPTHFIRPSGGGLIHVASQQGWVPVGGKRRRVSITRCGRVIYGVAVWAKDVDPATVCPTCAAPDGAQHLITDIASRTDSRRVDLGHWEEVRRRAREARTRAVAEIIDLYDLPIGDPQESLVHHEFIYANADGEWRVRISLYGPTAPGETGDG